MEFNFFLFDSGTTLVTRSRFSCSRFAAEQDEDDKHDNNGLIMNLMAQRRAANLITPKKVAIVRQTSSRGPRHPASTCR